VASHEALYELPQCRLRALQVGRLSVIADGRRTGVTIPILAYLLDAPGGLFAVDCGLSARWAGGGEVHLGPEDSPSPGTPYMPELDGPGMGSQLATLGLHPQRLVCTHLHEDHAGGAADLGLILEASVAELRRLAEAAGRVVERNHLFTSVWGPAFYGDERALDVAGRLKNFALEPRFWGGFNDIEPAIGAARGHFWGHFHCTAAALRAILEYALQANDTAAKDFVRDAYEYARHRAVPRLGLFPGNYPETEGCTIADMVALGEKTFGSVDILVNNAGIQFVSPIEEFPIDKWDAIIAINLSSAFHGIRAVVPGMKKRGWGRIINTASAHSLVASPFKSAYVSAKHGIAGLTKTVALEVATFGVTANCVSPGYVWTPAVEAKVIEEFGSREAALEAVCLRRSVRARGPRS